MSRPALSRTAGILCELDKDKAAALRYHCRIGLPFSDWRRVQSENIAGNGQRSSEGYRETQQ